MLKEAAFLLNYFLDWQRTAQMPLEALRGKTDSGNYWSRKGPQKGCLLLEENSSWPGLSTKQITKLMVMIMTVVMEMVMMDAVMITAETMAMSMVTVMKTMLLMVMECWR